MASRVCYGCGLTVDGLGNLIANTGGAAWPYACPETNGVPIVCGSDGVLRSGMPEKFHIRDIQYTPFLTGQVNSATFGSPIIGGASKDFGPALTYVLDNPSDCLPMTVAIRYGVHHMALTKVGSGNSLVLVGTNMTTMGGIVASNEAHQQWRHDGSVSAIVFDSQNSTEVNLYTLAAGGSATITARAHIVLTAYNGNTSLTNHSAVLDVEAWN